MKFTAWGLGLAGVLSTAACYSIWQPFLSRCDQGGVCPVGQSCDVDSNRCVDNAGDTDGGTVGDMPDGDAGEMAPPESTDLAVTFPTKTLTDPGRCPSTALVPSAPYSVCYWGPTRDKMSLRAVAVPQTGDIWAGGDDGALVRWTGSAMVSATLNGADNISSMATSPAAVATGQSTMLAGDLGNVWVLSAALGTWTTPSQHNLGPSPLSSIAVDSNTLASSLSASGPNSAVARTYNGSTWTPTTLAALPLRSISLSNARNFATGADGLYESVGLTNLGSFTRVVNIVGPLTAVWALPTVDRDVWVATNKGQTVHYTGVGMPTVHNPVVMGDQTPLFGISGVAANHILAVGASGKAQRWDGSTWIPQSTGIKTDLYAVHCQTTTNCAAAGEGGAFATYNGTAWTVRAQGLYRAIQAVWTKGNEDGMGWAVGDEGLALRWTGTTWATATIAPAKTLRSVWGFDASHVYAAGDDGSIYFFDGATWRTETVSGVVVRSIEGISGFSEREIWAVGTNDGGNAIILRRGDTGWTLDLPAPRAGGKLHGVWAVDRSQAVAVGEPGLVMQRKNGTWTQLTAPSPTAVYRAVTGTSTGGVFIVGNGGQAVGLNGSTLTSIGTGLTADVNLTAAFVQGTRIYAAGTQGGLFEFINNNAWTKIPTRVETQLTDLARAPDGGLWLVGRTEHLLHYKP